MRDNQEEKEKELCLCKLNFNLTKNESIQMLIPEQCVKF